MTSAGPATTVAEVRRGQVNRAALLGMLALVVAVIWAVTRVGPQTTSDLAADSARALDWPNPGLDGLQAYNRTSPVGPLLLRLIPGADETTYFVLHLVAAFIAVGLIAAWPAFLAAPGQRLRAARLMILGPVTASVFISIGNYDPFTLIGLGLFLFAWSSGKSYSRFLMVATGVYLGFQHFEQTLFAVIAMSIGVLALRSRLPESLAGKPTPAWGIPGVLLGKVILSLVFVLQGIDPLEGRGAYIADEGLLREALVASVNHFPVLLMSLFAGLWVVAGLAFFRVPDFRSRLLLLASAAIPFVVAVSTLAQTRVFIMAMLPLVAVMVVVVLSDQKLLAIPAVLFTVELLAWVSVPQNLYVSPGNGARIMDTNALDYVIMLGSRVGSLLFG